MRNLIFILFILLKFSFCIAQNPVDELSAQGYFVEDSISLGKSVAYSLSIKHNKKWEILFPDSSFAKYEPFEFESKKYFITHSDSVNSTDSVVYYLSTFETNSIQYLSIPVFYYDGKDSVLIYSNSDSIAFKSAISPDLVDFELKENTDYRLIDKLINFSWIYIISFIILILIALYLIFFRKKIQEWILNKQLKNQFANFEKKYASAHTKLSQNENDKETLRQIVLNWKEFLEKTSKKPYSTFTTREMAINMPNTQLIDFLKLSDKLIYGDQTIYQSSSLMKILLETAEESYKKRLETVKK